MDSKWFLRSRWSVVWHPIQGAGDGPEWNVPSVSSAEVPLLSNLGEV